jgi:hypothetical protein
MQVPGFHLTVEMSLSASGYMVASFSHLLKYLAQFHLALRVPRCTRCHSVASAHTKMVLARWMEELANKLKLKPETSVGTSLASKHHFQKNGGQHRSEIFKQIQSTELVSAMRTQMFVEDKHLDILEISLSRAFGVSSKNCVSRYSCMLFDIPEPCTQYLAESLLDCPRTAGH